MKYLYMILVHVIWYCCMLYNIPESGKRKASCFLHTNMYMIQHLYSIISFFFKVLFWAARFVCTAHSLARSTAMTHHSTGPRSICLCAMRDNRQTAVTCSETKTQRDVTSQQPEPGITSCDAACDADAAAAYLYFLSHTTSRTFVANARQRRGRTAIAAYFLLISSRKSSVMGTVRPSGIITFWRRKYDFYTS